MIPEALEKCIVGKALPLAVFGLTKWTCPWRPHVPEDTFLPHYPLRVTQSNVQDGLTRPVRLKAWEGIDGGTHADGGETLIFVFGI